MEIGYKDDYRKLRYDLVPVEAHQALAEVFTYGSTKYPDDNWKRVESHRYTAALFRHINAWLLGEDLDADSKLHHLKHALSNLAILIYKEEHDEHERSGTKEVTED